MQSLIGGQWIRKQRNRLITGPAGGGKTSIACALAHQACRDGFTAQHRRVSRLFDELSYAHADGRYPLLMKKLAGTDVLVIDAGHQSATGRTLAQDHRRPDTG